MPVDLRYDKEKSILYATVREQLSPNEFSNAAKEIVCSNDYPPDVRILWDIRSIKMPLLVSRQFIDFTEIRKKYPERGKAKIAVIVSSDLAFGMSRMYEMLSSDLPQHVMIFKNIDQGEQWLQSE